jgi:NAD(P)-dependent dehydrogenase (short-subunit alcohol dehydrogenase family)
MAFTGNVVLVAGGTGGLGRAVSLAFLNEGAKLIVTYVLDQEFSELRSVAGANASRLVGRKVDVTNEGAVQQLIEGILEDNGRLDVLVNTVGGYAGGIKLWEQETRVLDQML